MEERTSIIEVGDEVEGPTGSRAVVRTVAVGTHGILLTGDFTYRPPAMFWSHWNSYLVYELPPGEIIEGWYGWDRRATIIVNGQAYGDVAFGASSDVPRTIEYYDAEWGRTTEAMKAEEGVMQSRPTEIRLN